MHVYLQTVLGLVAVCTYGSIPLTDEMHSDRHHVVTGHSNIKSLRPSKPRGKIYHVGPEGTRNREKFEQAQSHQHVENPLNGALNGSSGIRTENLLFYRRVKLKLQ